MKSQKEVVLNVWALPAATLEPQTRKEQDRQNRLKCRTHA